MRDCPALPQSIVLANLINRYLKVLPPACLCLYCTHYIYIGDNIYVVATYEFASEASYANTLVGGETCNALTVTNDLYKESLETFILWLESEDSAVCFARDQALFLVPSNDGNYTILILVFFDMCVGCGVGAVVATSKL